MPKKNKYSKKQIINALIQNNGLITFAAKSLGCHRNTISNAMREDPSIWEAYVDFNEVTLDLAENVIRSSIMAGDVKTAMWFLEKKGQSRGYGIKDLDSNSDEHAPPTPLSKETQKLGVELLKKVKNERNTR